MTELTEIKKIPVLRAMALISEGMGKIEACTEVGISRWTYDRMLDEHPDLIQELAPTKDNELRIRLEKIIRAKVINQERIVEKAFNADLSFRERLSLDDKLAELQILVERELGIVHEEVINEPLKNLAVANDFLNKGIGVRLRPGTGKITQTLEFDIERDDGEIIDGEVKQD